MPKKVPRPSYGKKIVHGSPVPWLTIFRETERFFTYIAQRSMFPYTLRITPRGLSKIMNLPGKKAKDEAIEGAMCESNPTKKAMEGMPCELSMLVCTTLRIVFV